MPRDLSDEVIAVKNSQRFIYYDCAEITLPQMPDDAEAIVLRVSSAQIEVGGDQQESDLHDMGDLGFSEGAELDSVDFSLTNLENTYSDIVGQIGRRLYPAPAIVSRAFLLPDGTFEPVEMLTGFAKFSSVDGVDAKVTIVSDLNRRGVDMVESITQHCLNIYKGPGCDSPDSSPTCSRVKDDTTNGCAAKAPAPQIIDDHPPDNRPSFKGLPQPVPIGTSTSTTGITPGVVGPGGVGPGGWSGGDYDPFDPIRNQVSVL